MLLFCLIDLITAKLRIKEVPCFDPGLSPCRNPNLPPGLCPKVTALEKVPLIFDQFFDTINVGKYHQAISIISDHDLYTGMIVKDFCCTKIVGDISELVGDFVSAGFKFEYHIINTEYCPKDAVVTVKAVIMQMEISGINRIFYSTMQFVPEVFCEYKLSLWNIVEFSCADTGDYVYEF